MLCSEWRHSLFRNPKGNGQGASLMWRLQQLRCSLLLEPDTKAAHLTLPHGH